MQSGLVSLNRCNVTKTSARQGVGSKVAACDRMLQTHDGLDRLQHIERILEAFVRQTGAGSAYVCDRGGYIIARHAAENVPLEDNLAALCAGAFLATHQIAKMIGEEAFDTLSQLGQNQGFFIHSIDGETLLLVFFDKSTTAGLVKFQARRTIETIMSLVVEDLASAPTGPVFELESGKDAFPRATT